MKKIALLHTVHSVCDTFDVHLKAAFDEELLIYNTLDEFLAMNARPSEEGRLTENNKKRIIMQLMCGELTGADVMIVTCSSLTPFVRETRSIINIPIFCIDEPMLSKAAGYSNVLVLATAKSTQEPTLSLLSELSGGKSNVCFRLDEKALDALKAGDRAEHDARISAMAADAEKFDVVVLAQASMAHMAEVLSRKSAVPVLDSPSMCIKSVIDYFKKGRN